MSPQEQCQALEKYFRPYITYGYILTNYVHVNSQKDDICHI